MTKPQSCRRLLIFVVAWNAQTSVASVLHRVPQQLGREYDAEILVIDDASTDRTFECAVGTELKEDLLARLRVLVNPVNQGYGGDQKIGYQYAMDNGFDYVALIHGDGQYAPECLPDLLKPLDRDEADAVFGSRMLIPGGALQGGMPLYKYVGNRILTLFENALLKTTFSELHSGYRVYSVEALRRIPFELNTNDFHFDTEITLQLLIAGYRIKELPIPTYYGDEISHVNGVKYALNVCVATMRARAQELNLFYDRKYDCSPRASKSQYYRPKLGYRSSHSLTVDLVEPNSRVLDLGCAGGYLGEALRKQKGCFVTGVDSSSVDDVELDSFIVHDLDNGPPNIDLTQYDYILLLDVLEHLKCPEAFVEQLRIRASPDTRALVSTANVAFLITRLSLLFGRFSYGKRGILDLTHLRLFTFASLRNLFQQANYDVVRESGTPIPFPLIFGDTWVARLLLLLSTLLVRVHRKLFSFQIFMIVQPRPSLPYLLQAAEHETDTRLRR